MDKYNFEHSLKNIPLPPRDVYLKTLFAKTDDFVERIRWKVFFHLNPQAKSKVIPNTYGFKTARQAPQSKELNGFEQDLYELISKVEFKSSRPSHFQCNLAQHVIRMNKSDKIFMLADKTTNIYQIAPASYYKLLTENITKDYEKTSNDAVKQTSKEAKAIAENLELADRIEVQSTKPAYVTLKDHKSDFMSKPKCRLINPAKTQIGEISKQLLEQINSEIRASTGLQQWRSTGDVLNWFTKLENKPRKRFMQIDIVEYYPSISNSLLDKALDFASQKLNRKISTQTIDIVKNARNSFLYTNAAEDINGENQPWRKKTGPFDVTMGAPDGAEICELVGLLLLEEIRKRFPDLNFGLYRDDGLAVHRRIPGPRLDSIRKELHKMFAEFGLKITVETNLTQVNFLDTTLDLCNESYTPYRKPNDTPLYINVQSNHPHNVIKEIPETINKRLNSIASSKEEFDKAKNCYQKALDESGYRHKLTYTGDNTGNNTNSTSKPQDNKKKKRNIVWYNPPYNSQVKTNIGRCFLGLLDRHFPEKHTLRKVINRNCIKISYSCTPNVRNIIQTHNNKVLKRHCEEIAQTNKSEPTCNCRVKAKCPLNGNCRTGPMIYKATINAKDGERFYIGSTQNFKERHANHKASFKDEKLQNATTLSKYIWENKLGPNPDCKWTILRKGTTYSKGGRYCDLCLTEKLYLAKALKDPRCLNKRTELTSRCAHKAKFKLSRLK